MPESSSRPSSFSEPVMSRKRLETVRCRKRRNTRNLELVKASAVLESMKRKGSTTKQSFIAGPCSSMSRDRYAGSDVTSRSSVAMTTSFPVATTTLTTACPGQCATVASAQCDVDEDPNDGGVHDYSCPGSPSDPPSPGPPHKRRSASDASDDDEAEMNVDSPDSGFESATPSGCSGADYFDDGAKSDAFDEVPKASSAAFAADDRPPPPPAEEYRLCLVPPKPQPPPSVKEQKPICRWDGCFVEFATTRDLQQHITEQHVNSLTTRFCCFWSGCKVYDKPTRNLSCLEQHIRVHTGVKRFQCWLTGCDASFSSQLGLARHVPSHFSEHHLPKAKLANQSERRYLVKRRRIKDKRKALANIHDYTDQRTVDVMVASLVRHNTPSLMSSDGLQTSRAMVRCVRRADDGRDRHLSDQQQRWQPSGDEAENRFCRFLFFGEPRPRCRKRKAVH